MGELNDKPMTVRNEAENQIVKLQKKIRNLFWQMQNVI